VALIDCTMQHPFRHFFSRSPRTIHGSMPIHGGWHSNRWHTKKENPPLYATREAGPFFFICECRGRGDNAFLTVHVPRRKGRPADHCCCAAQLVKSKEVDRRRSQPQRRWRARSWQCESRSADTTWPRSAIFEPEEPRRRKHTTGGAKVGGSPPITGYEGDSEEAPKAQALGDI
jgi:hypothetical protein